MLPVFTKGQNLLIDEQTGKYAKQAVIEVENQPKQLIYKKAVEWITLNYKSANDVIQLKDESEGKIILKGNFSSNMYMKAGLIEHTLILEFKDNKFRYSYTDLAYYSAGSGKMPFEGNLMSKKKLLSNTEQDIDNSIKSLSEYIFKSYNSKDDW